MHPGSSTVGLGRTKALSDPALAKKYLETWCSQIICERLQPSKLTLPNFHSYNLTRTNSTHLTVPYDGLNCTQSPAHGRPPLPPLFLISLSPSFYPLLGLFHVLHQYAALLPHCPSCFTS